MIEFHRLLLGDKQRNEAFAKALEKVIVPGKTIVADIGSGTGYLSFIASKLGAKECHLYEIDEEMFAISKQIAKDNSITNCVFHKGHSSEVKNPVQADVVISETLGNYALEENIVETLRDARRFLKPDGVMIPQKLRQFVAPVVTDRIHRELDVWDLGHGLDFSKARELCFNNVYVRTLQQSDLLPNGANQWDAVDFYEENDSDRSATIEWTPGTATVYGFVLWWTCELLPGLTLTTAPGAPHTHWEHVYLPLPEPIVTKNTVRLALHSDTRYDVKVRLQWSAEADGKMQEMDMEKG